MTPFLSGLQSEKVQVGKRCDLIYFEGGWGMKNRINHLSVWLFLSSVVVGTSLANTDYTVHITGRQMMGFPLGTSWGSLVTEGWGALTYYTFPYLKISLSQPLLTTFSYPLQKSQPCQNSQCLLTSWITHKNFKTKFKNSKQMQALPLTPTLSTLRSHSNFLYPLLKQTQINESAA